MNYSLDKFTPNQRTIFAAFAKSNLHKDFYFTGGTALSVFYFNHRESEDLDFFSESDFDTDPIVKFMDGIASQLKAKLRTTLLERVRIFELVDSKKNLIIKVDFAHYPFSRLKKGLIAEDVEIDSLEDIGANKLHTILQRTQVKDFADLYFLLKEYTIWDLLHFSQEKFKVEIDLIWLASGLLKAQSFEYLPKMRKSLSLEQLKSFYKDLAKQLGKRIITR